MLDMNIIYNIDCREGMKQLSENSIATCICDPPYNYEFIGKDWNYEEIKRRMDKAKAENSSTLVKNIPYGSGLAGGVRNARWYERNRENVLDYQEWTKSWGVELYRVMKQGGLCFIFNSTRTIAHIQVALEECGFYTRDIIVWRRHSGIPKGLNVSKKLEKLGVDNYNEWQGWHSCLRNEWESILIIQKPLINNYIETLQQNKVGLFYTKCEDGGFRSNIIENIPSSEFDVDELHCTVKPLNLIKMLIEMSTPKFEENIIMDIFMGSGTTAIASKILGYNYIGFEMIKEYYVNSLKKLENVI